MKERLTEISQRALVRFHFKKLSPIRRRKNFRVLQHDCYLPSDLALAEKANRIMKI